MTNTSAFGCDSLSLSLSLSLSQVIWGVVCNALLGDRFSVFWPFHKDPVYRTLFHFMMGEQTDRFIALSLHTEFAEESRLLSGEQTDRFIALSPH